MSATMKNVTPRNQIWAKQTDSTITVYQAYSDEIADSALRANTLVSPPFKLERMTWIKPSFFWMLYRAGWGFKDKNQKRILAIEILKDGFIEILKNATLSNFNQTINTTHDQWKSDLKQKPIRIQWDPERDYELNKTNKRTIQIGLKQPYVSPFISQWIVSVREVTELAHTVKELAAQKEFQEIEKIKPVESLFEIPETLKNQIGIESI